MASYLSPMEIPSNIIGEAIEKWVTGLPAADEFQYRARHLRGLKYDRLYSWEWIARVSYLSQWLHGDEGK